MITRYNVITISDGRMKGSDPEKLRFFITLHADTLTHFDIFIFGMIGNLTFVLFSFLL